MDNMSSMIIGPVQIVAVLGVVVVSTLVLTLFLSSSGSSSIYQSTHRVLGNEERLNNMAPVMDSNNNIVPPLPGFLQEVRTDFSFMDHVLVLLEHLAALFPGIMPLEIVYPCCMFCSVSFVLWCMVKFSSWSSSWLFTFMFIGKYGYFYSFSQMPCKLGLIKYIFPFFEPEKWLWCLNLVLFLMFRK